MPHSPRYRLGKVDRFDPSDNFSAIPFGNRKDRIYEGFIIDRTARKRTEAEKDRLVDDLRESFSQVKLLCGMLPICANCKKIRDDQGYWKQVERYLQSHAEVRFSHSCCPECDKRLYPHFYKGTPSQ
jgi:hypothetical protein